MQNTINSLYKVQDLETHLSLLNNSFKHFIGKTLFTSNNNFLNEVNNANYGLVSHGNEIDPIFNFGNKLALELFEYSFDEFTKLPSRLSAQAMLQEERELLLKQAATYGFIDNYKGIRISSKGNLFEINDVILWNVIDENNLFYGQAALIKSWKMC